MTLRDSINIGRQYPVPAALALGFAVTALAAILLRGQPDLAEETGGHTSFSNPPGNTTRHQRVSEPYALGQERPPSLEASNGQDDFSNQASTLTGEAPTSEAAPPETPTSLLPVATAEGTQAFQQFLDLSLHPAEEEAGPQWKAALQALSQVGDSAIPAITEFLEHRQDYALDQVGGTSELGYDSVRMALFDALADLGTPAAENLLFETLRQTADPREIEQLAMQLERLAPGAYHTEALAAAQDAVAMADEGLLAGYDLGPAFAVLGHFGGLEVVPVLASVSQRYGYYGLMAMARLPDQAKADALFKMATPTAGSGSVPTEFALRLLAEWAWTSPASSQALIDLARSGELSPRAWTAIAEGLGGIEARIEASTQDAQGLSPGQETIVRRYHIASGNQNFVLAANSAMPPEELTARTSLLNQLLTLRTGSAGEEALTRQLDRLDQLEPSYR